MLENSQDRGQPAKQAEGAPLAANLLVGATVVLLLVALVVVIVMT